MLNPKEKFSIHLNTHKKLIYDFLVQDTQKHFMCLLISKTHCPVGSLPLSMGDTFQDA